MTGTQQIAADLAEKGYHITSWDNSLGKAPRHKGWHQKARYPNPGDNIGLIHGLSGTVCLDVDNLQDTRKILAEMGIDLDSLLARYPKYYGGSTDRPKLVMKMPDHAAPGLDVVKMNYPDKRDGEAFSIRGSNTGKACQDVLPGSIHPTTKQPYRWYPGEVGLPKQEHLPDIPEDLLALWENWSFYEPRLQVFMGWKQPEQPAPAPIPKPMRQYTGTSPIEWFNSTYTLREILLRNGYTDTRDPKRMQHPNSSSGTPGIVLTDDGKRGYSHGSDPLPGQPHGFDAFEAFKILEHQDNTAAATAAIQGVRP